MDSDENIFYDDSPPTIMIEPDEEFKENVDIDDDEKNGDEKNGDDEKIDDEKNNNLSIVIKTLTGKTLPLKVNEGITVKKLKKIISKKEKINLDQINLIYQGKHLENYRVLSFYNIMQDSNVHLVLKSKGKGLNKENPTSLTFLENLEDIKLCNIEDVLKTIEAKINIQIDNDTIAQGKKRIEEFRQKFKSDHISDDEFLSTFLYTTDLFYKQFNKDCREGNIKGWESVIYNMLLCLRKLPYCWDICYRGIKDVQIEYKIGAKFAWEQFASSSGKHATAEKFSKSNQGTLFIIKHWTGRKISDVSRYKLEDEVLLMPCSFYKVTKVEKKANCQFIECEEIPLPWGKKHVLWVDDNPAQNKDLMEELECQGISTVIKTSTEEVIDLLTLQDKLLTKPMSEFRIVTDMVREYGGQKNYYAGAELIKALRDKGYHQEILVFCRDEKKAEENCLELNIDLKDIIITKSSKKLKEFCKFS